MSDQGDDRSKRGMSAPRFIRRLYYLCRQQACAAYPMPAGSRDITIQFNSREIYTCGATSLSNPSPLRHIYKGQTRECTGEKCKRATSALVASPVDTAMDDDRKDVEQRFHDSECVIELEIATCSLSTSSVAKAPSQTQQHSPTNIIESISQNLSAAFYKLFP